MVRRPPGATRTDTLFPYTTLFRSSLRLRYLRLGVGSGPRHQVYMLRASPPGEEEEGGIVDLATVDLLCLAADVLLNGVLSRFSSRRCVERPRVFEGTFGEVGRHGLVRCDVSRHEKAGRSEEVLEGCQRAVTGPRRVRPGNGLTVPTPALIDRKSVV